MTTTANPEMRDRAAGALLGTFAGDALGMPHEGHPGIDIPEHLSIERGWLEAGSFTDDTQMMLALCESLLRCDVVDEEDLAATFRAHHEPRRGYGSGTSQVFGLWSEGLVASRAASTIFDGEGSFGNGAAMRVAPLAIRFYDDDAVLTTQVRRSARLTHAHPAGIDAAAVQACAVAAALDDRAPVDAAIAAATTSEMRTELEDLARRVARDGLSPASLRGSSSGIAATGPASVAAAVFAGSLARDAEAAISLAVRAGGDTDTVAAMTGAIAGARFGAAALPDRWMEHLEGGWEHRAAITAFAVDLADRASSPNTWVFAGAGRS